MPIFFIHGETTPSCPKCGRMMMKRHPNDIYDKNTWICEDCDVI